MAFLPASFHRFFIKLFNWEYWPFNVVYTPIYFYWFYLCIKARAVFFINTANPSIRNGGFLMESKKEIYDLIPQQYYPLTIICSPQQSIESIQNSLLQKAMQLPLIAKPDIGMRGMQVKLVKTIDELKAYNANTKVPYLLQNYIAYENEVGIFYYKYPNEKMGAISGIVAKEFLNIVGDGQHTIAALLAMNSRFALQIPALQKLYGNQLQQILPAGELRTLVPYGNHSRGAKFIDITSKNNQDLTQVINTICNAIDGFYFGRLDIKYNTWEQLCKGENMAIIEVNGAGSEPTHMYDPAHSIFFAWKEIIRHLDILYKISVANKKSKNLSFMTFKEGMQMLQNNKQQVKLISQ